MRCAHLSGHRSKAHADLCASVCEAHPFVRAFYAREDLNGPRYSVAAYEAMTRGDDAEMNAVRRELDAFVARAKGAS